MSEELKPCPFCGGEASRSTGENGDGTPWRYVECLDCAAMAEEHEWQNRTGVANEISVAINTYRNTRPAKPLTADKLYQIVNALQQSWANQDAWHKPNGEFSATYNEHLAYAIHAALPDQQELVDDLWKALVHINSLVQEHSGGPWTRDIRNISAAALAKFGGERIAELHKEYGEKE